MINPYLVALRKRQLMRECYDSILKHAITG